MREGSQLRTRPDAKRARSARSPSRIFDGRQRQPQPFYAILGRHNCLQVPCERRASRMDYLWTPWRYQYMKQVESGKQPECIFCDAASRTDDSETLVAYRGAKTFVILNRFPYTSGHAMIVPYAHVGELGACEPEALSEMMKLAQRVESAFRANYKPDGLNLGMNL